MTTFPEMLRVLTCLVAGHRFVEYVDQLPHHSHLHFNWRCKRCGQLRKDKTHDDER